jgi:hypothetical protein
VTPLARAAAALLALQVGHALDHVANQPSRTLATEVTAPGLLGIAATTLLLALAWRRRPEAPALAVLVGFGTVLGFAVVHLAPHWSAFSDPYGDLSLNAVSWVMVALPMVAALYVGLLGLRGITTAAPATP